MYLLDTNHCSLLIAGNPAVLQRMWEKGNVPVYTCTIVRGELIFMVQNSQQKATNIARVQAFLQGIYIYPVDNETADIYGQFKAEILPYFGPKDRKKRRKTKIQEIGISDNDLWIAAIALRHGLTIVSADSDFQRMQQVRALLVESWL
ncbi:MAG: type II toxin-antitoxin system VapC family toxin [Moorea sp. SIOASIH]|uniref:type II toxin-antitoxin system VapC family toxin n=1 Tax=Moorena sp. SIOASIH TaxID=2607817 RepID=UPI0013B5DF03|nr:type II toxin-antitoxin system VapC family toxin [Moorena sp. SIOASIH]NEO38962.1 type II toxin-antitoxin system VapC family toxin [Moorena sp. SIOASIH]